MNLKDHLEGIVKKLEGAGISNALIGGLAVGALGYQRFTNDIDLLIDGEQREKTKTLFLSIGFSVFNENEELIQFEKADSPNIDIIFARRHLSRKMLESARQIDVGSPVRCLSAEGIIGLKIQAYAANPSREFKEKADIQALIERHELDWDEVRRYSELFGKWEEILEIRKRAKK